MEQKYAIAQIGRLRMGIDGEGIRTLILFKGCSLRCRYCINPYTWDEAESYTMLSAKELYERIIIDRLYMMATNGGVTFGGGEPLLQSQAIKEFSDMNYDSFSIYVETSLHVPKENLESVISVVDRYYIDIKSTEEEIYKAYTGKAIGPVFDNLKYLIDRVGSSKIVVRIPMIPGFTDNEIQLRSKEYLASIGIKYFDLFEYRMRK